MLVLIFILFVVLFIVSSVTMGDSVRKYIDYTVITTVAVAVVMEVITMV